MTDQSLTARELLPCATPKAWVKAAVRNLDTLLIDHANCEKKAAATAMNLMFRYGERLPDLQDGMSKIAREELRHFEQVTRIMRRRGIPYRPLTAARYAEGLRKHLRKPDRERLTDLLVIGAFIEARSCERFATLVPVLEEELAEFYQGLHAAEARHFQLYLAMARKYGTDDVDDRVAVIAAAEAELIQASDEEFRFHSGVPEVPTKSAH
ncbi:MAG TPA: tRNA-(ms[2]io[6]A)-hydroxylase [Gammaproteobacteria bacterium]|jgi:tRNA-(ms[2]io[6]A)-hydroxylase|nr:tRNA-(ms[2]io[6]A)-hydroxylase [Gammaproteobacteria bacterium]